MKNKFTFPFLFFALLVLNVHAHPLQTKLKIEILNNQWNAIEIDGVSYGKFQQCFLTEQLAPGFHAVRILGRKIVNRHHKNMPVICFNGTIEIRPNTKTIATIDNRQSITVQFERLYLAACNNEQPNNYNNHYTDNSYNSAPTYYPPAPTAVCPEVFSNFKRAVASSWFDSDKKRLIANFLKTNLVSTEQLYQLISQLDFENSKLEIAKIAYPKTVDRQNYYTLFSLFDFENSKRELSDYMANC
jgi:hypothetical protein